MDRNRILLAMVVLTLAVGFVWGATKTSGFAVVRESEAAQIVGGAGYVCDPNAFSEEKYWGCEKDPNNPACGTGAWCYRMARRGCIPADSGECDEYLLPMFYYGACAWNPETGECMPDGEVYVIYVEACG